MTRVLLALLLVSTGLLLALVVPATAAGPAPVAPVGTVAASTDAAPAEADAPIDPPAGPPAGPPACTFDDQPAERSAYSQWHLTVLDTVFALPADYVPPDLVLAASAFGDRQGGADFMVRSLLIDDLTAMIEAAGEEGVELAIQSAYRSHGYQESTFQYWVDRNGREEALATSARAGHSEHQLGTALDFRSLHGPPAWELGDWASTPEGAWMAENAWRFGFVMSYPRGSKDLTCYSYEPWHYRYLGRALAAEVESSGLTPREVLWADLTAEESR